MAKELRKLTGPLRTAVKVAVERGMTADEARTYRTNAAGQSGGKQRMSDRPKAK